MAKPIRKTPTLKSAEANRFISKMIATENRSINNTEKKILKLISC